MLDWSEEGLCHFRVGELPLNHSLGPEFSSSATLDTLEGGSDATGDDPIPPFQGRTPPYFVADVSPSK